MDSQSVSPKKRTKSSFSTPNKSSNKKPKNNTSQIALGYFTFKDTQKINGIERPFYTCNECNNTFNGTNHGNLAKHLQRCSKSYREKVPLDSSIEEKRFELLMQCVEMVAINGRSFTHLNDSALRLMLKEKLDELEAAGRKLNLENPNLIEVKNEL